MRVLWATYNPIYFSPLNSFQLNSMTIFSRCCVFATIPNSSPGYRQVEGVPQLLENFTKDIASKCLPTFGCFFTLCACLYFIIKVPIEHQPHRLHFATIETI